MYHSVLRLIKCTLCGARGKQFEQEASLGGARAEHLSGWREMDALKQSYMDCSANFLTENERESRRMTEGFLRLSGEHLKNDHFCFL